MNRNRGIPQSIPLLLKSYMSINVYIQKGCISMNMKDLKVYLAIIVLTEDTLVPASWDEDEDGMWPWRKVSIVPSFATMASGEIDFINGLSVNGFNPEALHKNFGEIHHNDIPAEVEKIKAEISSQYSGEIQILWR